MDGGDSGGKRRGKWGEEWREWKVEGVESRGCLRVEGDGEWRGVERGGVMKSGGEWRVEESRV